MDSRINNFQHINQIKYASTLGFELCLMFMHIYYIERYNMKYNSLIKITIEYRYHFTFDIIINLSSDNNDRHPLNNQKLFNRNKT